MIMLHPLSAGYHHLLRILSCSDIPTCMEYLLPDFVLISRVVHCTKITKLTTHMQTKPPKLMDHVASVMMLRHYSAKTHEAYAQWIKRFILFHEKPHPLELH